MSDGNGDPIPDALIEIWQADEAGASAARRLAAPQRPPGHVGRVLPRHLHVHRFRPGRGGQRGRVRVPDRAARADGPGKAAFFCLTVFARGLTNRLFTRAYLPADEAVLRDDRSWPACRPNAGPHCWPVSTVSAACGSTSASRATTRPCSSAIPASTRPGQNSADEFTEFVLARRPPGGRRLQPRGVRPRAGGGRGRLAPRPRRVRDWHRRPPPTRWLRCRSGPMTSSGSRRTPRAAAIRSSATGGIALPIARRGREVAAQRADQSGRGGHRADAVRAVSPRPTRR